MTNHLARAWQLYELRRDKLAVEELQQHLAEWPEDVEAYRLLTFSLARLEDSEGALAAAKKCVELAPEDSDSYYAKAIAEEASFEYSAAERSILAAIRIDPARSTYFVYLAQNRINRGRYEEAQSAAEKAIALNPNNPNAIFYQAFALWAMELVAPAREAAERGLRIAPEHSNLHSLYGQILSYEGSRQEGMTHLLESLRINPENEWAEDRLIDEQEAVEASDLSRLPVPTPVWEREEPPRRISLGEVYASILLAAFLFMTAFGLYSSIVTFFSPKPPESHFFDPRHPDFLRHPMHRPLPFPPKP